jgi:hypothetical protein
VPEAATLRAAVAAAATAEGAPDVRGAAAAVAEAGGDSVRFLLFFGSRKTGARPDAASAYDFFVVVDGYRAFYRAARTKGILKRRARLASALNLVLPPNQVAVPLVLADGTAARAKCAVVRADHFARDTSWRRRDHFSLGRLFQPAAVAWCAGPPAREEALDALERCAALTLRWSRPWLPRRFGVEEYCRTLLRVSFAAEIRPEPEGRAEALWRAQEADLRAVYGVLLREAAAAGALRESGPALYALPQPASTGERLRLWLYFRWSLVRATARWLKHVVTFEGWLDFIVRKARRHSGQDIVLSEREKRMPLIFLWPRLIQYLRHKDK